MTNKKNWLAALIIALVFGFMVIGCPDTDDPPPPDKNPGTNPPVNVFNGTWVCERNEDGDKETLILNENAFEISINDEKQFKGTFAFALSLEQLFAITLTITHISTDMEGLSEMLDLIATLVEDAPSYTEWITKTELTDIMNKFFQVIQDSELSIEDLFGDEFEDLDDFQNFVMGHIEELFATLTGTALPGTDGAGNITLTITINGDDGDNTTVYTKQP
jgi:hypothetical protein